MVADERRALVYGRPPASGVLLPATVRPSFRISIVRDNRTDGSPNQIASWFTRNRRWLKTIELSLGDGETGSRDTVMTESPVSVQDCRSY